MQNDDDHKNFLWSFFICILHKKRAKFFKLGSLIILILKDYFAAA